MNSAIKYGISFTLGGVIGATISFFVTRHICEEQARDILNQVRAYYSDKKEEKNIPYENEEKDYAEFVKSTQKIAFVPPPRVDYSKIAPTPIPTCRDCKPPEYHEVTKEDGEEYDPDYEEDDGEDIHPEDSVEEIHEIKPLHPKNISNDPPPYVITEQEYFMEDGLCQREALTYYEADGVITDDLDAPVDQELIGIDNIALLEDQDVIYVKNFECGMKWEIVKTKGSFHELMLAGSEFPEED